MDIKEIIDEIDNGKIAVFEVSFKNYLDFRGKKYSWLGYVDTQKNIKSIIVTINKISGLKNKIYKADAKIYYKNEDISESYNTVKIYSSEIKENIDEINKLSNGKVSFKKRL